MATLTRRGFIKRSSLGAAVAGALATAPNLAAAMEPEVSATGLVRAGVVGPLVAHVSDIASGEITVVAGMREVVIRDPELIARLVGAVR